MGWECGTQLKVKADLFHVKQGHTGGRCISLSIIDLGAGSSGWTNARPGRLARRKHSRYQFYRMGPRDHWGRVRKASPPPGFERRRIQPVAGRCID
jgi:hypothetical protein